MRYAIFSDLHDNYAGLTAVLADAAREQAEQLIYLGDAGEYLPLLQGLQERNIPCVFGNWEVSIWQRLPPSVANWVGNWPATIRQGAAIFSHATPDVPSTITTTASVAGYMSAGISWHAIFPRLNRNESSRWNALAALEAADARVAFHGHTHIQEVYAWASSDTMHEEGNDKRQLRLLQEPTTIVLEVGNPAAPNRYLVGVGSAGAPDDGPQLRYAIYDDATQEVTLRRL